MKKAYLYLKVLFIILLLSQRSFSQCINTFPYNEGFEAAPTWTSGGANNDWAWGTPAHPTINTAGGGTKSWCVGGLTGSFYNFSEQCWLQSPCFDFTTLNYPWISFKIFWECEQRWDGLQLQYSTNGGATWTILGAFGDPVDCNTANWYNYANITWLTSAAVKNGWNGRIGPTVGSCQGGSGSAGWVTAKHCLTGLANQPNVIFRFLMGSGTTCNSYDGIAIDDIHIDNGMVHTPNYSVICAGTAFNFTAINPPCPVTSTYTWNFGDPASGPSNTSTLANPTHVFSAPGTYSISLTTGGGGCNPPGTITQTLTVNSFTPVPITQSITCFGMNNGSGTVSALGAGPFTYTWSPTGGNSNTASNLSAGIYSVQIKDPNNCTVTNTLNIIQPPVLTAPVTSSNVACNGGSTGSATVTPGGGTGPYTYTWSPTGGNSSTASNLTVGSYTVLVKDANNCTVTAVANITQPTVLSTIITSTNAACGSTNGNANVNVSGGSPAYTYTWSPTGGNSATASGLAAGNYTVLVKDANNCTVTAVAIITQPNSPTVSVASNSVLCFGGTTGSAIATVTGGTPAYTYTWSPTGGNSATASSLVAGTYTILVKDASNCTVTAVTNITQPTALTAPVSSSSVLCNGGNTGSATVTAGGGTPGYTYTWSPSGGNSTTANNLTAGSYTVLVKDANNCTVTAVTSITQPPALTAPVSSSSVLCNGGNTGSATVTPAGGTAPYSYTWNPMGGNAATASNLTAGSYTVLVKDANNCTVTAVTAITQPPALTASVSTSNATCGMTNGSATVTAGGGSPGYTYSWSPSGGTGSVASGLGAGNYTALVTDSKNCTVTASGTINQPVSMTVAVTTNSILCFGGATGSASVSVSGGTSPYSYTWSPAPGGGQGTSNATGLTAQTYTVNISDAMGCSTVAIAVITQPISAVTAAVSSTSVLCNGGNTGSATVTPGGGTPGYTYTWSPTGGNSVTASNLTAGSYTILVKDAHNCTVTAVTNIVQPTILTAPVSSSSIMCFGGATGSATVTAGGGTPGYTYTWSPTGGNSSTASNLMVGSYTVLVKDANNCTVTAVTNVIQPASAVTAPVSSTSVMCFGGATGSATVNPSGGTPVYSYTWNPTGGNSATASNLTAGSYTVLVKDANNCTVTAVTNVIQPASAVTAPVSSTSVMCFGGATGSATVNASGGTPGYTYTWSPSGGNAATASNLTAGNYTVLVKDANNCTVTAVTNIAQPASAVTAPVLSTNVICFGGATGSATVNAVGGTPGYTYTWSPTGGNSSVANNLSVGNYTVLVKDANNCTVTAVATITQPSALTASVSTSMATCGMNNGSATVTAGGGSPGYTYNWSPSGGTSAIASGLGAGNYTVLITDSKNCTVTASGTVNQPVSMTAAITTNSILCFGGATGSASVSVTGGTTPYSYTWSPAPGGGQGTSNATGLTAQIYTVSISDNMGCSTVAIGAIVQPSAITAPVSSTSVMCFGGATGSATVNASGGTPGYTYIWSPTGGNAATASNLTVGSYTVLVKDANNCTVTAVTNVIQPASAVTAPVSSTSVMCFGGATGSATVNPGGGTPGYTYTWSPMGGNAATASNLTAGSYTVLVKDANNCTVTAVTNVTQPASAVTVTISSTNATCGQSNGSATVSAGGGTPGYTYSWSPTGGNSTVASGFGAGVYTVTVRDANNCVTSGTANISQPSVIVPTINAVAVTCFGGNNGASSVSVSGGVGPFTYSWSPAPGAGQGTNLVSGLSSQSYTVVITDSQGCFTTAVAAVNQPQALTANLSSTNTSCNGSSNGYASVTASGGTGAYTYNWTPAGGTSSVTIGVSAGSYSVTIKDANNCSLTATVVIGQPAAITSTVSSTGVSCFGSANGGALVNAAGGTPAYSYTWLPSGGNASSANNLAANTYTVLIKDANNCVSANTVIITQPSALSIASTKTNTSCYNGSNGSASVTVNGGTAPYSYAWSVPGNTNALINGLGAGSYSCLVTDANNCSFTATVNLGQPSQLVAVVPNYSTCAGMPANVSGSASGGTAPYTFSWNGGTYAGQIISITPSVNTVYTLVVTDNNGCTSSAVTSSVAVFNQPTLTVAGTNTVCAGGSVMLNASVSGAPGSVTYLWMPGSYNTPAITVSPSSTTIYSVSVNTAGLCPLNTVKQITVTVSPNPVAGVMNPNITGCAPLCIDFTDNSSTSSGTIIGWSWNFSNGGSSIAQNPKNCFNVAGTYTGEHTVVNSFGCISTMTFGPIVVSPKPVADFNHSPIKPIVNIDQEVVFTDASWGTPIVSWNWYFMNTAQYTSTQQNPTFSYTEPGTYVVALVVKSDKGCIDTLLRPLVVGEDFGIYVPNAFTPNDDGFNDKFQPKGFGIVKYELYVFDRWGEKLFHTNVFEEGWDGTYQGRGHQICEEGVYTWLINVTDVFSKSHELKGHVTLIK